MLIRIAAFSLALFLHPASSQASPVVLHDAEVVVDTELVRGTEASVHVATFGATGLTTKHGLSGSLVKVSIRRNKRGAEKRVLAAARTGADGTASVRFTVPRALVLK